jgi:SAM-dependent methyltransferase
LLERNDLTEPKDEKFRPVACSEPSWARRVLDLQCGSIWSDVLRFMESIKDVVPGTLLDVGCGAQPYRRLLPQGWAYLSIDWQGSERAFGYESSGTIYYDGEVWPIEDRSVDIVFSTETLEHIPKPSAFLNEASRCLTPGGRLFITVPFAARWHFIPFDYWRFTPSGLKSLLEESGFTNIKIFGRGNEITVAAYKLIALAVPLFLSTSAGADFSALKIMLRRLVGVCLMPVLVPLFVIGNLSLRMRAGSDCLGYTAVAQKMNPPLSNEP